MPQIPFVSTAEINAFVERELRTSIIDQRYGARPIIGILRSKKRIVFESGGSIISQPILAAARFSSIESSMMKVSLD